MESTDDIAELIMSRAAYIRRLAELTFESEHATSDFLRQGVEFGIRSVRQSIIDHDQVIAARKRAL